MKLLTENCLFRRESPWKVDGESTGVSSKLKLLEQELLNLEKIGNGELSKVPSLMRKQARRYQVLTGKIDDLCRRMVSHNLLTNLLNVPNTTKKESELGLVWYLYSHSDRAIQNRAIKRRGRIPLRVFSSLKKNSASSFWRAQDFEAFI